MSSSSSDAPAAPSWAARIGQFVKDYWHWALLLGVSLYVFRTVYPDIDVSTPIRPAPDFAAATLDGDTFRLSDYRGEIVVLNVWATWCPPCRVEIPGFIDLQREFGDRGVQFVGLTVDQGGVESVRGYVEEKGMNYPQVDGRRAAQKYPGEAIPRTYLIDRQGRIRYAHTGVLMEGALRNALETLTAESE
jgi:peroxiredoxin